MRFVGVLKGQTLYVALPPGRRTKEQKRGVRQTGRRRLRVWVGGMESRVGECVH